MIDEHMIEESNLTIKNKSLVQHPNYKTDFKSNLDDPVKSYTPPKSLKNQPEMVNSLNFQKISNDVNLVQEGNFAYSNIKIVNRDTDQLESKSNALLNNQGLVNSPLAKPAQARLSPSEYDIGHLQTSPTSSTGSLSFRYLNNHVKHIASYNMTHQNISSHSLLNQAQTIPQNNSLNSNIQITTKPVIARLPFKNIPYSQSVINKNQEPLSDNYTYQITQQMNNISSNSNQNASIYNKKYEENNYNQIRPYPVQTNPQSITNVIKDYQIKPASATGESQSNLSIVNREKNYGNFEKQVKKDISPEKSINTKTKSFIKIKHRESQHEAQIEDYNDLKRTSTAEFGKLIAAKEEAKLQASIDLDPYNNKIHKISYNRSDLGTNIENKFKQNAYSPVRVVIKDKTHQQSPGNLSLRSNNTARSEFSEILLNSSQTSINSGRRSQLSLRRGGPISIRANSQNMNFSYRDKADRHQTSPLQMRYDQIAQQPDLNKINIIQSQHERHLQGYKKSLIQKIINKENIKVNGIDVNKIQINNFLNLSSETSPTKSAARLMHSPVFSNKNLLRRGVQQVQGSAKEVSVFTGSPQSLRKGERVSTQQNDKKNRLRINPRYQSNTNSNSSSNSRSFSSQKQQNKVYGGMVNFKNVGVIRSEYDAFF